MTRHPLLTEQDRIERERRKASEARLDLDVEAFVKQVKALPVFKDCPRSIRHTKVVLVHTAFTTGGRAHGNRMARIRVTFAPVMGNNGKTEEENYRTRLAWTLETVVHELVHCALPDYTNHNERFRLVLARAVRELWGIEVDPNPAGENGRVARYGLDAIIEAKLEEALAAGAVDYPRRVEAPKPPRAVVMASLVEKRAAHAAKMLDKAEKRAKAAQRVLSKWRKKVNYYERQAARKP